MITHAHTAYDGPSPEARPGGRAGDYGPQGGTRTYRDRRQVDVAYAAGAAGVTSLARAYPDWTAFGAPTQADGLFLLVAPGYRPDEVPLDPGADGWLAMEIADIAEFAVA